MGCRVAGLSQRKRPAQVVCLGVCTPPRHHEQCPRGLRAGASSGCRGCGVGGPGAVSHAFLCRGTRHRGPRVGDGGGGSAEPEEDARGPVTRAPCRLGAAPAGRSERGGPRPVQSAVPRPGLSPRFISMTRWPTDPPRVPPHPAFYTRKQAGHPQSPAGPRGLGPRARRPDPDVGPALPSHGVPATRRHRSRRCPHRRPREGGGEGPPGRRGASRSSRWAGRPGKSRRNSDNSGPGPRAGRAHSGPCVCVGVGQVQVPVLAPVPDLLLIRRRTKTSRTPPAAPVADARKPSCRCSPHRQGALAVRPCPAPHAGSPRPTPTTHRPRGARLPFLTFPDLLVAARHSDLCLDRETAARRRPGRRGDPSAP